VFINECLTEKVNFLLQHTFNNFTNVGIYWMHDYIDTMYMYTVNGCYLMYAI